MNDTQAVATSKATSSRASDAPITKCFVCEQTLFLSFFFDALGHDRLADLPKNRLSNLSRIFEAHRQTKESVGIHRFYYEGLGTDLRASPGMADAARAMQFEAACDERDAVGEQRGFADEITIGIQRNGPRQTSVERRNRLVHVLTIEIHAGFQPQGIAGAQATRRRAGLQQRLPGRSRRSRAAVAGTHLMQLGLDFSQVQELVAGVDEVGRGPLCGAVVTAAVILDPLRPILGLNDSKKLTAAKREELNALGVNGLFGPGSSP